MNHADYLDRPTRSLAEVALELFGEFEAALDKQIYPQQSRDDVDPAGRKYSVTLTARDWRRFNDAMLMLEQAAKASATSAG